MNGTLRNDAGDVIAWTSAGNCQNSRCRTGIAAGRPVHVLPAHTDPRAAGFTLALADYHYPDEAGAAAALERAWETATVARTFAERDAAYARGEDVKVVHGITG